MNPMKLSPLLLAIWTFPVAAAETTAYRHGEPSGDEQYMLELINRARANPRAEGIFLAAVDDALVRLGIEFFNVNVARLKADFASYPVRPPLAFSPELLASSRRHSQDMAENNFQDHSGTDGSTISTRVVDAGYSFAVVNENIYSSLVSSTLQAHAGFNIDWGNGANGVQEGVGHRRAIMGFGATDYREIGIGIVSRSGTDAAKFGKLSITQDFGSRFGSPMFLLGVAYLDVNGNAICDPGEGIPGIRVQPATGSFHAITSASGGYAIPFSAASGSNRVTFSGGGLETSQTKSFAIDSENVKVDLRIESGEPLVTLEVIDGVARESGAASGRQARIRIHRIGPQSAELNIVLAGPSAKGRGKASGADFKLSATPPAQVRKAAGSSGKFTVTIPAQQSFAEINLTALADQRAEPTEKARFSIGNSNNYRIGSPRRAEIFIKP